MNVCESRRRGKKVAGAACALMAKIDVKSAYRIVPVHPVDRRLLAMEWEGKIFVDAIRIKVSAKNLQCLGLTNGSVW